MTNVKRNEFETVSDKVITLKEISETVNDYPLVVQVMPNEWGHAESNTQLIGNDLYLEKPKCLQFVLVEILQFDDGHHSEADKQERSKYVGKQYLIPICYPGTLKLINRSRKQGKYTSIKEVKEDLPRFIRIDQTPDKFKRFSSIEPGTILEVKRLFTNHNANYVKCKSFKSSRTYNFSESLAINCTAVDDLGEHTLLNLASAFILLPKNAQFLDIDADDIIPNNLAETGEMLSLLTGPIKILKTFIRRHMFIGWIETEGNRRTHACLIPEHLWDDICVRVKSFAATKEKEEYIKCHFGDDLDLNFIVYGLYTMKPDENDVMLLAVPNRSIRTKGEDRAVDYEDLKGNTEREERADYEDLQGNKDGMYDCLDICSKREEDGGRPHLKEHKEDSRSSNQVVKDNLSALNTIAGKAKHGFNKIQKKLSKRIKPRLQHEPVKNEEKHKGFSYSLNEKGLSQMSETDGYVPLRIHSTEMGLDRPLSQLSRMSSNVAYDENVYEMLADKNDTLITEKTTSKQNSNTLLQSLSKDDNIADRSRKDFYTYTVEEVVECLKECNMNKLAVFCQTNSLDGAFFRGFDLEKLTLEPILEDELDLLKVKKITQDGWRPSS